MVFNFSRLTIEARQDISFLKHSLFLIFSIFLGIFFSLLIILDAGIDIKSIYEEFIVFTFFNSSGFSTILVEATPLLIVGLSAAMAFRINFWNIGIEGQFFMGVIGATIIAIFDIGNENIRIFLMFFASILFGAFWIIVPMILKIKLKINEVVTTLLFNYFAFYFVLNQVYGSWKDPIDKFPHSEQFDLVERLPKLGWEEVNSSLLIALALFVIIWILIEKTSFGIKSKFCGSNDNMALAIGIPFYQIMIISALFSGGLSGVAGFVVSSAHEFRLTPYIAVGYGFSGIVIAFLANNKPFYIIIVAFLIGSLYVAGDSLKVFYNLPSALVSLIQAIIVLCVASSEFFIRYKIKIFSIKERS